MSGRLSIRLKPEAQREIEIALRWWETNRHKAPEALKLDIAQALDLICESPGIGVPVSHVRLSGLRRLHLSRTRYCLYYRVRTGPRPFIDVLAFWHASRTVRTIRETPAVYGPVQPVGARAA